MIELKWKKTQGGYYGFCKGIHLFTITYDSWSPSLKTLPWILRSNLPGLENWREESEYASNLMTKARNKLDEWLESIGLTPIKGDCYSA